ncbi:MAG: SDR family oxidoreductase [Alphaproteobacteria bacterium]|mgnify:CR=1 FL=1|jgi:2-dehydro-3-deoxy-L-rhamnonate dehydrogenase (NAD+)|nr:SDR family oxidoreductase [Alphaproteobacteria bacterium]
MNENRLSNRCAVVTGGAQGIGRAIAERFLAEGAKVCLWDADGDLAANVTDQMGENAYSKQLDVTDPDAVTRAAETTVSAMGGIDILVNNAGISGPNVPTWKYPVEDWLQVLDIDLNGVFYCCRAVVPIMRSVGYGRVVNIASVAGKEGNPNAPAYSAAKAGVIGLTKSLGKELAETDIRVNCVTPAVAKTRIFDQMTEEHIGYMLSKIPMGRFVEVEEIAALVAWLSSEECSFSTGAVFDITGGRSTY